MSSEFTTSFPLWRKNSLFWRQWYISRKKSWNMSYFTAWYVPLDITRRHLSLLWNKKFPVGHAPGPPPPKKKLWLPSAIVRWKPRLVWLQLFSEPETLRGIIFKVWLGLTCAGLVYSGQMNFNSHVRIQGGGGGAVILASLLKKNHRLIWPRFTKN